MPKFDKNFLDGFLHGRLFGAALLSTVCVLSGPAVAQENEVQRWWQQAKDKVATIYDNGNLDVFLSGYAYHGRNTYSPERIAELNEQIWGGGAGKSIRNAKGNEESIYFLAFRDSHYKPQFIAGYLYQWMGPVGTTGLEAGIGLSPMLISRQDYFGGFPFPIILPVASIGPKSAKFVFSYVPRLSENKGNGDVLLLFLRFEFN